MNDIPTPRTDAFRQKARTYQEAIDFEKRLERDLSLAFERALENASHRDDRNHATTEGDGEGSGQQNQKRGVEKARDEFAQITRKAEEDYAIHGKEPWELI